ncbi:WD40/YVTN/BNR-like repeat-containing protein [Uliginosibacterium gangwonense]|uniref:WD40/YVTN/BNR-like repeat-containing protein n=1 Tax=Uliginosibacterium gangwonense TaxID=392736 RepID=UPI00035FB634|nr:YCF48-related protein [Uliginosibacterium gangwonense]
MKLLNILQLSCALCLFCSGATAKPIATVINAELSTIWASQNGQLLLAGGEDSTLLRSDDGGKHWQQTALPGNFNILQIEADSQAHHLALGEQGLLYSTDEGKNWAAAQVPAGQIPSRLMFDGKHGRWLATNAKGGMLYSKDGGRKWQTIATLPNIPLLTLSTTTRGGIVAAGIQGTILYSADGRAWHTLKSDISANIRRILPLSDTEGTLAIWSDGSVSLLSPDGKKLSRVAPLGDQAPTVVAYDTKRHQALVGNMNGEVWRSSDAGQSWQTSVVVDKVFLTGLHANPLTGELIASGGRGTVARSQDGGDSWELLRGNEWTSRLQALTTTRDGQSMYAVGTGGLTIRSDDYGNHWTTLQEDTHRYVADLAGIPESNSLVAAGSDGLLIRSEDAGQTWHSVATGLKTDISFQALLRDPRTNTLLACGPMSSLTRSTNGGQSWQGIQPVAEAGEGYFKQVVTDTSGNTMLLVGSPGQVVRSADNGQTWHATDADTSDPGIEQISQAGQGIFIATRRDGRLLRSTDDGQHWTEVANFGIPISGIYTEPQRGLAWAMGLGKLFHSTDHGASWKELNTATATLNFIMRSQQGSLLGFGNAGIIMRSVDDGINWQVIASGIRSSLRKPLQNPANGQIFVPGRDGTVLSSNNDGLSWSSLPTHTRGHLNRLWLSTDGKTLIASGERIVRINLP